MAYAVEQTMSSHSYTPSPHEEAEAIADLLGIALAYHALAATPEQREEARNTVHALVNKWLELVSPLPYIEGLVGEVHGIVGQRRLWDIGFDEEVLRHIVIDTVVYKEEADRGAPYPVLDALGAVLSVHIKELIEKIAGNIEWRRYPVIKSILESPTEPDTWIRDMAALASLLLVMLTNK